MRILPDEQEGIEEELIRLSDLERCDLVLTTAGTGFSCGVIPGSNAGGFKPCGTRYCGGDPRGQHGDHKTGDAEPGSECNPSSDADYQSAGKPEGGGRESWICT